MDNISPIKNMNDCIVFVSNAGFIDKFCATYESLRVIGEWKGDVCLIVGDDVNVDRLREHPILKIPLDILYFPDIKFTDITERFIEITNRECGKVGSKLFQYHKFHLFQDYFRKWDRILYLDVGMKIFQPVAPIFSLCKPGNILAHSDSWPSGKWRLIDQFHSMIDFGAYEELCESYPTDILMGDYFQTTMMLFSPKSIICGNTFDELIELVEKYPISCTNDQGIIALYFISRGQWIPLPTTMKVPSVGNAKKMEDVYTYDFCVRNGDMPYIMTKYYVFND